MGAGDRSTKDAAGVDGHWLDLAAAAPLTGIHVLELPGGVATRYCGGLFSRLGAQVVQLKHAERGNDDDAIGYGGDAGRAYGHWLDQGKRTVAANDALDGVPALVIAGQDDAAVERAESLIEGAGWGDAPLLSITWFDAAGPYGDWVGTDEVLVALSGLSFTFGERSGPPVLAQGHVPQVLGGAHGFIAGMAALLERADRRPRRIDVNIVESVMCLTEIAAVSGIEDERAVARRLGVNRFSPTYPCASYRTSDGWVGVTALTPAQWRALCRLIGREEWGADPGYRTSFSRLQHADEIDEVLGSAFRVRTTAEWVAEGMAARIPMASMVGPAGLPEQEHWRRRGAFAAYTPGGVLAPTGPVRCRFDGHPMPRWQPTDVPGPLSGIRVVDFSMGWAGPWATRTLGDLGADVVKVESAGHPDWWRGWEVDEGGDPPATEIVSSFNAVNRNKRGVALDLASPSGLEAAKALVAQADIVVENFAAGVLDKLGLGQDVQRRLRPGVISISMAAFGADGPWSAVRAYGSTVEQASGLPFANGCDEWPPAIQHVAFGDPVAGVYTATALLVALHARQQRGGADLDLAQVACLFELGADAIIGEQLDGRPLPRTGSRRRQMAPCCVVPAEGDDAWVAVVVGSHRSWQALCSTIGREAWATDPALATVEGRHPQAEAIEAAIAAWARSIPADAAAEHLQAAGVPAAPLNRATSLGADAQLLSTGFWETLERRYVGEHAMGASPLRFDGSRPALRRPAPVLGEHTDEVLGELGLATRR